MPSPARKRFAVNPAIRPSTTRQAQLKRPCWCSIGSPRETIMPFVTGKRSSNTRQARFTVLGERKASSQPYPVMQSSGRHNPVTPLRRASSIAAWIRFLFPTQSSGIWFNTTAPTLISFINEVRSQFTLRTQDQFGFEFVQRQFETRRILMRIVEALDSGMQHGQLALSSRANRIQRRQVIHEFASPQDGDQQIFEFGAL